MKHKKDRRHKLIINEFGKELKNNIAEKHFLLISHNGRFEGPEILLPHIRSIENAASWYLYNYGAEALNVIEEQVNLINEGYDSNTCFGYKYKDVVVYISDNCISRNHDLSKLITSASDKRKSDSLYEGRSDGLLK